MKTKKIDKKLRLNKKTVANLNGSMMGNVNAGGGTLGCGTEIQTGCTPCTVTCQTVCQTCGCPTQNTCETQACMTCETCPCTM